MITPRISIIVAIAKNNVIGDGKAMLWRLPGDFKHFKEITMGHPMIMGRKTWSSIGRPLPGRTSIVITHQQDFTPEGATVFHSLDSALDAARQAPGSEEIFIIGGGQIYKEAMDAGVVDRIYLTIVDAEFAGDITFPDYSEYKKILSQEDHEENGIKYHWLILER